MQRIGDMATRTRRTATALLLAGGVALLLTLGSCGDDGRCDHAFSDVPDIESCNALGVQYGCNFTAYATCDYTFTDVADQAACTQLFNQTSQQFDCGGSNFDRTTHVCAVTACLICDPPKPEPRCRLSRCLACGDVTSIPTPTPIPVGG